MDSLETRRQRICALTPDFDLAQYNLSGVHEAHDLPDDIVSAENVFLNGGTHGILSLEAHFPVYLNVQRHLCERA